MALTLRTMTLNLCLPGVLCSPERDRDAVHGPESHKCSVWLIMQGFYIGLAC